MIYKRVRVALQPDNLNHVGNDECGLASCWPRQCDNDEQCWEQGHVAPLPDSVETDNQLFVDHFLDHNM